MNTNQALTLILALLNKKHAHYTSIYNTTRQLQQLVSGEDPDAFGNLLDTRKTAMDSIDSIDREISATLSRLPDPLREKMKACLKPSGTALTLDDPLQTNIYDAGRRNAILLKRIIESDNTLTQSIKRRD